jgi:hypothetical protein
MKEVKEDRFKKTENMGFNPVPVPNNPSQKSDSSKGDSPSRTNVRSFEKHNVSFAPDSNYTITIPKERRKSRQSFDIFDDQYDALKKLQVCEANKKGERTGPKLGAMVQEALDAFIREKAKKLGNVDVVNEKYHEREF